MRTNDEGENNHGKEGGQDASHSAEIEPFEGKGASGEFAIKDASNEGAGDDEEDVHSEEASREPISIEVEEDDGYHGNCAQSVYVGTIGHFIGLLNG